MFTKKAYAKANNELKPGTKMANGAIYIGRSEITGRRVFTTPHDLRGPGITTLTAEFNDVAGLIDEKLNKENNFGHRNWRAPAVEEGQMQARLKEELGLDQTLTNEMEENQFGYPGWYWTSETEGLAERYAKIGKEYEDTHAYAVQAFDGARINPKKDDLLSIRAVYDEEDDETLEVAAAPKVTAKSGKSEVVASASVMKEDVPFETALQNITEIYADPAEKIIALSKLRQEFTDQAMIESRTLRQGAGKKIRETARARIEILNGKIKIVDEMINEEIENNVEKIANSPYFAQAFGVLGVADKFSAAVRFAMSSSIGKSPVTHRPMYNYPVGLTGKRYRP